MTILSSGGDAVSRSIAWIGSVPGTDAKRAFTDRKYYVGDAISIHELRKPEIASVLTAVVFEQGASRPSKDLADAVSARSRTLLDYGCQVVIYTRAGAKAELNEILRKSGFPVWSLKGTNSPSISIFEAPVGWDAVAHHIHLREVKHMGVNTSLTFTFAPGVGAASLDASDRRLLQRAYGDCATIDLKKCPGGKSGAKVFIVHARTRSNEWLAPHVVKLGPRMAIDQEFQNYTRYIEPFVPFHLRPHIDRERCGLGATKGLIAASFIDESENLFVCARDGRGGPAVSSLFEKTLRGWRRNAGLSQDYDYRKILRARLPREIPSRRAKLVEQIEPAASVANIGDLLLKCREANVLFGRTHGDLHASNIRVRFNDAVLIDFAQPKDQPLLHDIAALEAGVLIDGFADDFARAVPKTAPDMHAPLIAFTKEWLEWVRPLYDHCPASDVCREISPANPAVWFYGCVQQLRRYAREVEKERGQYAAFLACALVFKASKDSDAPLSESFLRAGALILAKQLLSAAVASTDATGG